MSRRCDMVGQEPPSTSIVGRRMQDRREALGLAQEKVGVAIGIDESSSSARINRHELGVHQPPFPTARLIANAMDVPLAYLYCEDDKVAELLLTLYQTRPAARDRKWRSCWGSCKPAEPALGSSATPSQPLAPHHHGILHTSPSASSRQT